MENTSKQQKIAAFSEKFHSENEFKTALAFSVVMTSNFSELFRRSLQITKIITNSLCVL